MTEFRAGVIVGAGSISFEMIRFMTELFPIVPGPIWLKNKSQPIAVQNVVDYLLAADAAYRSLLVAQADGVERPRVALASIAAALDLEYGLTDTWALRATISTSLHSVDAAGPMDTRPAASAPNACTVATCWSRSTHPRACA